MLPDRVSNPGPLTYESGALPIALRGPAESNKYTECTRYKMERSTEKTKLTTNSVNGIQKEIKVKVVTADISTLRLAYRFILVL